MKHNIHLSITQLFCTRATDNKIGADGATALVEGLKESKNLKELDLAGEFWMVASPLLLNVIRGGRVLDSMHRFKLML